MVIVVGDTISTYRKPEFCVEWATAFFDERKGRFHLPLQLWKACASADDHYTCNTVSLHSSETVVDSGTVNHWSVAWRLAVINNLFCDDLRHNEIGPHCYCFGSVRCQETGLAGIIQNAGLCVQNVASSSEASVSDSLEWFAGSLTFACFAEMAFGGGFCVLLRWSAVRARFFWS